MRFLVLVYLADNPPNPGSARYLVRKVLKDLVDVLLRVQQLQGLLQVRAPQLAQGKAPVAAAVERVEDAVHDCLRVLPLELGSLLRWRERRPQQGQGICVR
eukprot:86725-Chlamydomonas_euryale.AAC.2